MRVLIVEDDPSAGRQLADQLEQMGHVLVGQATDPADAEALFLKQEPDLVVLGVRQVSGDGIELAQRLLARRRVPMIAISAQSDKELINRACAAGVFGYLIRPVRAESFLAQVEVAVQRFREQEQLRQENQSLTQTLESRKLIERAKGIFMKRLGLSEAQAHRRLQSESQRRRVSMTELARKLVESEELLEGE